MKIDHIGYAVVDMPKAMAAFEALGYCFEDIIEDKDRGVYICFGNNGVVRVELISPLSQGSPIDDILKRNLGGMPYHICFQVSDIEKAVHNLKLSRYKIVSPPAPACAFKGKPVVFLYNLSVGLIELVEK